MNFISGLFNKAATGVGIHPGQTGNLLSGAALTKGAEAARRHHAWTRCWPITSAKQTVAAQHGAGLRAAGHRLSRDQFLDGLQLAHLLAERDLARAAGGISLARPSTASLKTTASKRNKSILDRVREPGRQPEPTASARSDKPKLDEYLTSVRAVEKRIETTRELARQSRRANARDHGQPMVDDETPGQRPARRHPRAHEAHVRHRRHGLPDRQDPRRHAHALPRYFRHVLSVPQRAAAAPPRLAPGHVATITRRSAATTSASTPTWWKSSRR